jgi:hypothetical protein
VGDGGVILTSADGVASWAAHTSVARDDMVAITCPTVRGCLGVDAEGYYGGGMTPAKSGHRALTIVRLVMTAIWSGAVLF